MYNRPMILAQSMVSGSYAAGCPADAITGEKKQAHEIDLKKCISCGTCRSKCPVSAIMVEKR